MPTKKRQNGFRWIVFCPAWDSFSSEKIFYVIALSENGEREGDYKCYLKTTEILLDADGHELI